jgi:predicted DNA-binding transcriptional regulator YafY
MPTNRHAQIRYNILDKCFSNFSRLYDYDDLLEEVNTVLNDMGTDGIQLRQLQYDIEHMKSAEGWEIEFESGLKKGRKKAFRYKDRNFSIAKHALNFNDTDQLQTTLAILSRYKHREEFSWLEELIPRMQQAFDLVAEGDNSIMSYQENTYLKGKEFIGVLFNLIVKQKQIQLTYQPYNKSEEVFIVNPQHLKQFNNRWFLFAYNPEVESIYNFPLDRILDIEELSKSFEPLDINWIDYFDDIVGVTKPEDGQVEKIVLKFSEHRINYVLTKPLHGSQRPYKADESGTSISIEVIPNRELYQLILSFGADVIVIQPKHVREEIKTIINAMKDNY